MAGVTQEKVLAVDKEGGCSDVKSEERKEMPILLRLETKKGTRESVEHLMGRCEFFQGGRAKWRRKWGI